jgi:hypothetical protein
MSKIGDYLTKNKLHPNRVVHASEALERRTSEDKDLASKKKLMKDGKMDKDEAVLGKKPRSGRPVTRATMTKVIAGQTVNGPTKNRIVRAVNAVLAQKKKPEIGLRDLF